MSGLFKAALFLTGDGLVRLISSFGHLLLLVVTIFVVAVVLKIASDD